jgi:hypothetical protein
VKEEEPTGDVSKSITLTGPNRTAAASKLVAAVEEFVVEYGSRSIPVYTDGAE